MEKAQIKSKISEIILKGGKVLLVGIFTLGYVVCDIYHRAKKEPGVTSVAKVTKTIGKVSVAINERNELMIIDRTNGNYEIYQDSVGRCIFNLYANSIQSKYEGQ